MPHTHKVAGSNPAGNKHIFCHLPVFLLLLTLMTHIEEVGSYGVMVSTLDFESSDPSSNLGRSLHFFQLSLSLTINLRKFKFISRIVKTKCRCVSFPRWRLLSTFILGWLIFRLFQLQRPRLRALRSLPLLSSALLPSWLWAAEHLLDQRQSGRRQSILSHQFWLKRNTIASNYLLQTLSANLA